VSFGFFNPSIENTPATAIRLFSFSPASSLSTAGAPGTDLGSFVINGNGTVTFTTVADIATQAAQAAAYAAATTARNAALAAGQLIPGSYYRDGDVIIGVHATGGMGSGQSVVADLGPIGTTSGTVATGDLGANLTTTFGSGWSTRTDLLVGLIAVQQSTATIVASSTPANPLVNATVNGQLSAITKVHSAVGVLTASSATGSVFEDVGSPNEWSSYNNGSSSFGLFVPTIEGTVGQTMFMTTLAPASSIATAGAPGTGAGTFKLNSDGTLAFLDQADANAYTVSFASSTAKATGTTLSVTLNRTGGGVVTADSVVTVTDSISHTNTMVEFFPGDTTKTFNVTLPQNINAAAVTNTLSISSVTVGGTADSNATFSSTEVVTQPGFDTEAPVLAVTLPLNTTAVTGTTTAGDLKVSLTASASIQIASLTVTVNGTTATTTGLPSFPTASLALTNQDYGNVLTNNQGQLNTVVITVTDVNGNSNSVTRFVKYTGTGTVSFNSSINFTGTVSAAKNVAFGALVSVTAPANDSATAPTVQSDHWTVLGQTVYGNPLNVVMTNALNGTTITANYVAAAAALSNVNTGTYAGLVSSVAGFTATNANNGYFTATFSKTGAMTGNLKINGATAVSLIGASLANDGTVLFGTNKAVYTNVSANGTTMTVALNVNGTTGVLTGKVYTATSLATITATHQNAAASTGSYTGVVPGVGTGTPKGDSFLTFTVSTSTSTTTTAGGLVTGAVNLADGKSATFSSFLSNGTFPVYVSPYGTTAVAAGSFSGVVTIASGSAGLLTGGFRWFSPGTSGSTIPTYAAFSTTTGLNIDGGAFATTSIFPGALAASPYNLATYTAASSGGTDVTDQIGVVNGASSLTTQFIKHTATGVTLTFASYSTTSAATGGNGILKGSRAAPAPAIGAFAGVAIQHSASLGANGGIFGYYISGTSGNLFTLK